MSKIITVNLLKLHKQAFELEKLSTQVGNSKINSKIESSRGEIADSINVTIDTLNNVGNKLSVVFDKTSRIVNNIASQFENMDEEIAYGYQVRYYK